MIAKIDVTHSGPGRRPGRRPAQNLILAQDSHGRAGRGQHRHSRSCLLFNEAKTGENVLEENTIKGNKIAGSKYTMDIVQG